jgi:hypothetical protein
VSELLFLRTQLGLMPADDSAREWMTKVKAGQTVLARVTLPRNPLFHRKVFALMRYAFDYWSDHTPPITWKGREVAPEFERFRKDITILAGYGHPVINIKGEVRYEAKSISYGSMDEEQFEAFYDAVIDTLLKRVFTESRWDADTFRWDADTLKEVVNGLLEFSQ